MLLKYVWPVKAPLAEVDLPYELLFVVVRPGQTEGIIARQSR